MSFIPVSVTAIVLLLWSTLYPLSTGYVVYFQETTNSTRLVRTCSDNVAALAWNTVIDYGVNAVLIVAVAIIATLTRKVEMDIFKDSKEVNSFVFATVTSLYVWSPYALIFYNFIVFPQVAFCLTVFPYLVIPFLCEAFLFIPKIWLSKHELHMKEARQFCFVHEDNQTPNHKSQLALHVLSY